MATAWLWDRCGSFATMATKVRPAIATVAKRRNRRRRSDSERTNERVGRSIGACSNSVGRSTTCSLANAGQLTRSTERCNNHPSPKPLPVHGQILGSFGFSRLRASSASSHSTSLFPLPPQRALLLRNSPTFFDNQSNTNQ